MNIEESIMYLKIKINTSKKQIESGEIWLDSLVSEEKNSNEAIETLLTAYVKEKEKNKKINEYVRQCDWHDNDVYIGEDILDILEEE